ncbi:hypothetical protein [Bradyrhizobium sp. BRP56]|uniref:hypothetical protein n=1 Tax=Bradyrhizobium sp. BRP56 TaxID=2793819 RepID=UPI001CD21D9C|nr:hypothetical protein [Bradyrhizobium sp. BRP56]MCA1401335.1 hypothetical protein [Bradyrhizobium sp. BRP56]
MTDDLKARNEAMIARFNKWLAEHPGISFSKAKVAFLATLTDDDRDFLLEHFLATDPVANKIMKG